MPEITIDPDPPVQGGDLEVGYTGKRPATLNVSGSPPGVWPATITIPATGTFKIVVPAEAESITITDPSGQAVAVSSLVAPA